LPRVTLPSIKLVLTVILGFRVPKPKEKLTDP